MNKKWERKHTKYMDRLKDQIENLKSKFNDYKVRLKEREKDIKSLNDLSTCKFIDINENPLTQHRNLQLNIFIDNKDITFYLHG